MRKNIFFEWFFVLVLLIVQTSLLSFNWLWLVAVWWGFKERWAEVLLLGLLLDLADGGKLGFFALWFLVVSFLSFKIREYLPVKGEDQVSLRRRS